MVLKHPNNNATLLNKYWWLYIELKINPLLLNVSHEAAHVLVLVYF